VFSAVREDHGTIAKIARDLHISVDELNEHVFSLVPVALTGGSTLSEPTRPELHLVVEGEEVKFSGGTHAPH
jgi:hypothetical protein